MLFLLLRRISFGLVAKFISISKPFVRRVRLKLETFFTLYNLPVNAKVPLPTVGRIIFASEVPT